MKNIQQIVIGPSPDRPALVLKHSADLETFDGGVECDRDGVLGRVLTALQALPDLLLANYVGTTKLMEVEIHGDLVRASDGIGFRAYAMGDKGVAAQAKLFEPEHLTSLVDIALAWRLASILVGQKHLADISVTLKSIEKDVSAIAQFQRDEQTTKIESAYQYLRQAERALSNGERDSAVRYRIEGIEGEMDVIQRHLAKLFDTRLDVRIKNDNWLNYSDIEEGFPEKLQDLQRLIHEHRLAGLTRVGALKILSAYPGGVTLKSARVDAIREATDRNNGMCESLESVMIFEVSEWSGKTEAVLTNIAEVVSGRTKFQRWLDSHLPVVLQTPAKLVGDLRPTGSDTPRLDLFKIAATTMIREVVTAELQSNVSVDEALCLVNQSISRGAEQTRYLVEWGDAGPGRIRQLAIGA